MPSTDNPIKKRGFAALSAERMSEIARMGAFAAHKAGVAYKFTKETARLAGKKGGLARRQKAQLV